MIWDWHRSGLEGWSSEYLFIVFIVFVALFVAVLFRKLLEDPGSNHPKLSVIFRRITLSSF